MVPVPHLGPGDYVLWHGDLVYTTTADCSQPTTNLGPGGRGCGGREEGSLNRPAAIYLPACPLTQTNALYLARQRKAFVRGHPGPDFGGGGRGETGHAARPGAHEVNEVGGDDGLRAMGLLPFDEDEAKTEVERELVRLANAILFPDLGDARI